MINGVLLLLLHAVIVLVSFFLIRMDVLKVDRLMLMIIICIPVFGFVSAVFVSMLVRLRKVGAKNMDLENMRSSTEPIDTIMVDTPESADVVPLEDALIMDDPSVRRSVMLDVLMSDTEGYLPVINAARMNDDVEVVHYATTAMVEISKDYELRAQEYSTSYAENPYKEGLLEEYISFLKQYVGSNMIQGQLLEIQRNTLMQLLTEKVKRSEDQEDFEELIETFFAEKLYSNAFTVLTNMEEKWPDSETVLKLKIRYFYETGAGSKLQELIHMIKNSGNFYSKEIRDMVKLWNDEKGEQRA